MALSPIRLYITAKPGDQQLIGNEVNLANVWSWGPSDNFITNIIQTYGLFEKLVHNYVLEVDYTRLRGTSFSGEIPTIVNQFETWSNEDILAIQSACHTFRQRGKHAYSTQKLSSLPVWSSIGPKLVPLAKFRSTRFFIERALEQVRVQIDKTFKHVSGMLSDCLTTVNRFYQDGKPDTFNRINSARSAHGRIKYMRDLYHCCSIWNSRVKGLASAFDTWKANGQLALQCLEKIVYEAGYGGMTLEINENARRVYIWDVAFNWDIDWPVTRNYSVSVINQPPPYGLDWTRIQPAWRNKLEALARYREDKHFE